MTSQSLPEHPDLDQLRHQAKELKTRAQAGDPEALDRIGTFRPVTLSVAQLVIAREYGFASWPALKAHVRARTADLAERVNMFLRASIAGPIRRAVELLSEDPGIVAYDFRTAVVLGEVARVRQLVAEDPGLAVRPIDPLGWPPGRLVAVPPRTAAR